MSAHISRADRRRVRQSEREEQKRQDDEQRQLESIRYGISALSLADTPMGDDDPRFALLADVWVSIVSDLRERGELPWLRERAFAKADAAELLAIAEAGDRHKLAEVLRDAHGDMWDGLSLEGWASEVSHEWAILAGIEPQPQPLVLRSEQEGVTTDQKKLDGLTQAQQDILEAIPTDSWRRQAWIKEASGYQLNTVKDAVPILVKLGLVAKSSKGFRRAK